MTPVAVLAAATQLVDAFASWKTYITLTCSEPVSVAAMMNMAKAFLHTLAKEHDAHVKVALCVERHASGGAHIHLLVDVAYDQAWVRWVWSRQRGPTGFAATRKYDARLRNGLLSGATWYVVKDFENAGSWMVGVACPRSGRCRRRTCVVGTPPWW